MADGLYAAGLTMRDIQAHLLDLYGLKVSPDLISRVTDAVLDEVREWQSRALDRMYPIVIFDALRVKIREDGVVRNKAVYLALGVLADGTTQGMVHPDHRRRGHGTALLRAALRTLSKA